MKIWLAGAKGAGKSELLKALEKYNLEQQAKGSDHPYLIPNHLDEGKWGDWALDRLADYRSELFVALDRADEKQQIFPAIYESSLIDNVAYSATRFSYIINDEVGSEDDQARWEILVHATARILRDMKLPDAVIYLPGHAEEDFYKELEEAIKQVIWELLPEQVKKYQLITTDPLQRVEEIATILKELDEPESTTAKPDGED